MIPGSTVSSVQLFIILFPPRSIHTSPLFTSPQYPNPTSSPSSLLPLLTTPYPTYFTCIPPLLSPPTSKSPSTTLTYIHTYTHPKQPTYNAVLKHLHPPIHATHTTSSYIHARNQPSPISKSTTSSLQILPYINPLLLSAQTPPAKSSQNRIYYLQTEKNL